MAGKLVIGLLSLSKKICVGSLVKNDTMWGKNRTDVTIDALSVVAQYVDECCNGRTVLSEIDDDENEVATLYTITVTKGK